MKKTTTALLVTLLALASCTKKEAEADNKEEKEKHEDNIVTLTKANLQHVEIKSEVVALGDLDMTLKATGRVSENMNKTAKVTSTLEGRISKLNFDINDPVKAG